VPRTTPWPPPTAGSVAVSAHDDRFARQLGPRQHLDRRDELVEVDVEEPSGHDDSVARVSIRRVTQPDPNQTPTQHGAEQPTRSTQPNGTSTRQQRMIAGRYAVVEEIGRGGMGIVCLAEDRTIGRRVAIKELHLPAGVPDDERRILEERVLREARTAGRLNDPAVVTVYDVVQESGSTYIVMELIQAPTLSAIVNRDGPLAPDRVARIAAQLLSALEAAHAAGIVHRDVKPSNIMVFPDGRVKLTDFGIAQSTDDPRLTTSGMLVGSPSYIAPERLRGMEADASSDLWALGSVLFYAVEGHSPFERTTTAATMHSILNEVPYLTRCQGPLASVIMGLLNGVPQARLSATQVRGLLAQVTQTPNGTQTVAGAGYDGGTAMLPGPGGGTRLVTGPNRPPTGRRWLVVALVVVLVAAAAAGGWFLARTLMAEEQPADAAKGDTMTYGKDGGDVPEFALSDHSCPTAQLLAGHRYPSDSNSACDDPHEFEVVAEDFFGSAKLAYPGADRLRALAESTCAVVFASDLVAAKDKNETLSYATLLPTKRSWDDAANDDSEDGGNRAIFCLIKSRNTDQQLQSQQLRQD
jgi:eukaryotic-like serine/threonine-protein kinase